MDYTNNGVTYRVSWGGASYKGSKAVLPAATITYQKNLQNLYRFYPHYTEPTFLNKKPGALGIDPYPIDPTNDPVDGNPIHPFTFPLDPDTSLYLFPLGWEYYLLQNLPLVF